VIGKKRTKESGARNADAGSALRRRSDAAFAKLPAEVRSELKTNESDGRARRAETEFALSQVPIDDPRRRALEQTIRARDVRVAENERVRDRSRHRPHKHLSRGFTEIGGAIALAGRSPAYESVSPDLARLARSLRAAFDIDELVVPRPVANAVRVAATCLQNAWAEVLVEDLLEALRARQERGRKGRTLAPLPTASDTELASWCDENMLPLEWIRPFLQTAMGRKESDWVFAWRRWVVSSTRLPRVDSAGELLDAQPTYGFVGPPEYITEKVVDWAFERLTPSPRGGGPTKKISTKRMVMILSDRAKLARAMGVASLPRRPSLLSEVAECARKAIERAGADGPNS
jgi:hypothetical protein